MTNRNDKSYKAAVGIRGDCLYCPLPLSVDSYWNCEADCHHCYFRRLNRTWGCDLRPSNPSDIRKKLTNGLKNKNPKSSLACALALKKTIRFGNKTDPFQDADLQYQVSGEVIKILIDLEWSFVIQTRFLGNMIRYGSLLRQAHDKKLLTIMPIISPGWDLDWKVLERKRTTPLLERCKIIRGCLRRGWNVGVNGEPFIPGFHTVQMFSNTLDRLLDLGVRRYNTYNLHFNDHVAKRLHSIGIDIKKIWEMNQDHNWKPILLELCDIAKRKGMILGCPDFVNTGWGWKEKANTCCGISVPNPSKFNAHYWKRLLQKGFSRAEVFERTWEGIGDAEHGRCVIEGKSCGFYTMGDVVK